LLKDKITPIISDKAMMAFFGLILWALNVIFQVILDLKNGESD